MTHRAHAGFIALALVVPASPVGATMKPVTGHSLSVPGGPGARASRAADRHSRAAGAQCAHSRFAPARASAKLRTMRRAGALRQSIPLLACLALAVLAGCGDHGKRSAADSALTFEQIADTSGLSRGVPVVETFDAYRMPGGSLRVKARLRLPEGTRVQVAVRRAGELTTVAMAQVLVEDGQIESPPMMTESGPLPMARYSFELSALFTPAWQSPAVLRGTNDGKSLRGPGITRTRNGWATFQQVEEMTR